MPRRLVAALLLSSVLGGCGYSLTGPAPNRPREIVPECDTSKALVVIDGLLATALGIATLSLVSSEEPAVALLPLALGAIYLGGAVSGNATVNKCNAARSEFDDSEAARATLAEESDDDRDARTRKPVRRPSEVVPQLPYQPTPYPADGRPGQPAYSPTNPPTPPIQYTPPPPSGPRPVAAQPPGTAQPSAPPPTTTYAPPQQPQPARPAPPPPRAQPRRPPADDTDWSDFWREVP